MNAAERLIVWLVGSGLASLATAWVAFQLQQEGVAPAVLLPLAWGAGLGGLSLAIWRHTLVPARHWVVAGAVVWGLLAVVAQDYIGHGHYLRRFDDELARQHPLAAAVQGETLRPGFVRFLVDRVSQQPVWWTLEALLAPGAAAVVVALGARPKSPLTDSQA
jgi:peptidoglycan/LPS O-acetylase OafA/YrhL